nr:hypothetical protein [Methylobacterium sp. L1A1]
MAASVSPLGAPESVVEEPTLRSVDHLSTAASGVGDERFLRPVSDLRGANHAQAAIFLELTNLEITNIMAVIDRDTHGGRDASTVSPDPGLLRRTNQHRQLPRR